MRLVNQRLGFTTFLAARSQASHQILVNWRGMVVQNANGVGAFFVWGSHVAVIVSTNSAPSEDVEWA